MPECTVCSGVTTVECPECKGTGQFKEGSNQECNTCIGSGEVTCPKCEGTGEEFQETG